MSAYAASFINPGLLNGGRGPFAGPSGASVTPYGGFPGWGVGHELRHLARRAEEAALLGAGAGGVDPVTADILQKSQLGLATGGIQGALAAGTQEGAQDAAQLYGPQAAPAGAQAAYSLLTGQQQAGGGFNGNF